MSVYYPNQALAMPMTIIRRERLLPPEARGQVNVKEGAYVNAFDTVAQGAIARRYVIVDLMKPFGIDTYEALEPMLLIQPPQVVEQGQVLAASEPDEQGIVVRAPINGLVSHIVEGRLFLESDLIEVEVKAGFNGSVVSIRAGQGVVLETTGALVQGAWGNGQDHFAMLRPEPEEGMMALGMDALSSEWRGLILLTNNPLDRTTLQKAVASEIGGIIAPSMPANLRKIALGLKMPVLLTEGFGAQKMSTVVYNVLSEMTTQQVALQAVEPKYGQAGRPEVIMSTYTEDRPPTPSRDMTLQVGANVRITRAPHMGIVAKVRRLLATPQIIDNGLRAQVAELRLPTGRIVTIPLANLELLGE